MQKCLIKNPDQRLGSVNGAIDLKAHPLFDNINWINLMTKNIKAPFPSKTSSEKSDGSSGGFRNYDYIAPHLIAPHHEQQPQNTNNTILNDLPRSLYDLNNQTKNNGAVAPQISNLDDSQKLEQRNVSSPSTIIIRYDYKK